MNLNTYYCLSDQIMVVTAEAGAIFIHGRTGVLYFYQEDVEGIVNANGEAYLWFWTTETQQVGSAMTPLRSL